MNQKELRQLVRQKIIEKFQKNLEVIRESEQDSLSVMSEADLKKMIRSKLEESLKISDQRKIDEKK